MFYRSIVLEYFTRKPYRDNNKNLISPIGPIKLKLVNYKGVDTKLHGCLVAEITVYANVRRYRCKRSENYFYIIAKHVQVGDYEAFLSKARAMAEKIQREGPPCLT